MSNPSLAWKKADFFKINGDDDDDDDDSIIIIIKLTQGTGNSFIEASPLHLHQAGIS